MISYNKFVWVDIFIETFQNNIRAFNTTFLICSGDKTIVTRVHNARRLGSAIHSLICIFELSLNIALTANIRSFGKTFSLENMFRIISIAL
jgi:hypothetical protein